SARELRPAVLCGRSCADVLSQFSSLLQKLARAGSSGGPRTAAPTRSWQALGNCPPKGGTPNPRKIPQNSSARPWLRLHLEIESMSLALRLENEFRCQQAVLLRHRRFGSIEYVRNELLAVRQRLVCRVDVPGLLLIDEEQMAGARPAGKVDILSDLDESYGGEDCQPPIAPGCKAIRSKPVHANVARAAVAPEHHIAKVFKSRILRMMNIAGLCGDHFGPGRAREK